jgi:hypothetical protein
VPVAIQIIIIKLLTKKKRKNLFILIFLYIIPNVVLIMGNKINKSLCGIIIIAVITSITRVDAQKGKFLL